MSGKYQQNAQKQYRGKASIRTETPSEVRRRIPQLSDVSCDEDAAAWLMNNVWVPEPQECAQCASKNVSELLWPADRGPGWRCLECGQRMQFLSLSIFCGLRCGPLGLWRLLQQYSQLDLNQAPRVTDLVQATRLGRWCCENFILALRKLESDAGQYICANQKLRGSVEVDATNLCCFHIGSQNPHYYHQIWKLEQESKKRRQKPPSAYIAHVQVLGAQVRGLPAVVHIGEPKVTPKGMLLGLHCFHDFFPCTYKKIHSHIDMNY